MDSDVIFVQFADNGNVWIWSTEPFFGGIRIKLSALDLLRRGVDEPHAAKSAEGIQGRVCQ